MTDDPRTIAARAIAAWGPAFAHQIAHEMVALSDNLEHGRPGIERRIPDKHRTAATAGAARCRTTLAAVRNRIEATT